MGNPTTAAAMASASAGRITRDALALGVRPGGVLLVHASLRSLGWVAGGAETVVRGLLDAVGPEGTVLMPSLSYEHVHADQRTFDVLRTPSNVGAVAEYLRTRPGTWRSVNPTHSICAIGARAEELVADHHLDDTPVGAHSPLRKLRDAGGQVLFLGCGLHPNTSMHGVEELVRPPYLFLPEPWEYVVVWPDGRREALRNVRHDFAGYRQEYGRLAPLLRAGTELALGRVHGALCHLVDARDLWARGLAALERDPLFFVQSIAP